MRNSAFFVGVVQQLVMIMIITLPVISGVSATGLRGEVTVIHRGLGANVDSIALQSADVYCRGASPVLTVTGDHVTWYADPLKNVVLARGNTYQAWYLDSTTTFYLTQTLHGTESAVTPIEIEIVEAFLLDVKTTTASCGKNDGTLTVTGKGGTSRYPLRYRLDDNPLQLSGFFDNLAGGTYTLTIDVIGCFGTSEVKVEKQPTPIISLVDQVAPRCGNSKGSIRVVAYGGNGDLRYSLDGQNYGTNNLFENLDSGDFTVRVSDDSLCMASQHVSLKESKKLSLNQVDITATTCGQSNGEVALPFASGNGTLSYSITGRPEQQLSVFDNLQAGSYQLSAKDEDGCVDTLDITVAQSTGPIISHVEQRTPNCGLEDGQITISMAGNSSYTYSLNGTDFQKDPSFSQLHQGRFTIAVKDEYGCVVEQNVELMSSCNQPFFLPSAFTPNNDGINDRWEIFFLDSKLDIEEITLFNRWGEVVLHDAPGFVGSGYSLWDGNSKGKSIRGIFTYKIRIGLPGSSSPIYVGTVLVL